MKILGDEVSHVRAANLVKCVYSYFILDIVNIYDFFIDSTFVSYISQWRYHGNFSFSLFHSCPQQHRSSSSQWVRRGEFHVQRRQCYFASIPAWAGWVQAAKAQSICILDPHLCRPFSDGGRFQIGPRHPHLCQSTNFEVSCLISNHSNSGRAGAIKTWGYKKIAFLLLK